MKRKTFLTRLVGILMIMSMFFGTLLLMTSCEDPTPPRPQCEIDNVGTVDVKNSTGHSIWTDVTWGNVVENYEKLLYNGNHYKYTRVPAGSIEIWVSFDGDDWYYEYESLSACEDMTFTWYLNARKSTGPPADLMVNGKTLEAKRGCDHPTKVKTWEAMK